MSQQTVARVSTLINAPVVDVWEALVTPGVIKRYMFGATVISDWHEGSPIVWQGEWEGQKYEDRGKILTIEPFRVLSYSHFSSLSGAPDVPENYHTVTIELAQEGESTRVALTQDNNESEGARKQSEENWTRMLEGLKKVVEP